MKPKEKAKELINKFYQGRTKEDSLPLTIYWVSAKECALIAIDEKIKLYNEINEYGHLLPNSFGLELHEIKTEIEKL